MAFLPHRDGPVVRPVRRRLGNALAADFSKGVLTVTMPKTAKAAEQQKKIEVKAAS
jgi:hypothetical protein